jgi:hypothetical protein
MNLLVNESTRRPCEPLCQESWFLAALAKNAPILPGADQCCYVDIDDTIKTTHGYAKQGAGYQDSRHS